MKRILKLTAVVALLLVALINVCTMLFGAFEFGNGFNLLPAALFEVDSGSMEPTLSVGDLLVAWETPYGNLKTGDIVTFHDGSGFVTHEIVRFDGSRLVTKGTANKIEDASIGPEEYCAKMLFAIPKGGIALKVLTSPSSLVLSVILILFIFYGMPIIKKAFAKFEKSEEKNEQHIGALRISASLAAVSVLAVTPFITAAKYTAKINEYTMGIAAAKYFSSNYISEEGTNYEIHGWNGEGYGISLQIKNFDNDLLFNTEGHDLIYKVKVEKVTEGGYKGDYKIELVPGSGVTPYDSASEGESGTANGGSGSAATNGVYGPYILTGANGAGKLDNFTVQITVDKNSNDEYVLSANDKIKFKISAETQSDKEYYQKMSGEFVLEVASANSFLGQSNLESTVGNTLVTYSLKTNQVGGNSTRNVKISWNNQKLYINEYEATVQNLKVSHPENIVLDDGTGRGYVILPLQAYSSVNLQFFKYDANVEIKATGYNDAQGHGHVADIYALEENPDHTYTEPTPPGDTAPETPDTPQTPENVE